MHERKIAKLPVVNSHNSLAGFVSRYDLKEFVKESSSNGKNNRKGERRSEIDEPITRYMKKMVITINRIPSFSQAVEIMEKHGIGSLVITDDNNKPMDIVTKSDLLKTISSFPSL
jgi:predicted transcriptional regulator